MLHAAALKAHLPWFVLTFLSPDDESGYLETICAVKLQDLITQLKARPQAQLAHLLMMAPPRWSPRRKWSRFQVDYIERGKHGGAEVLVYHVAGRGEYCFDAPGVGPEEVKHRKRLLSIDWFNHFER